MRVGRAYFEHSYYGCESGCCGCRIIVELPDGTEKSWFDFSHDDDAAEEEARTRAAEFGVPHEEEPGEREKLKTCW